jgi:phage recombination protein Bet
MNEQNAVAKREKVSLIETMAFEYGMEPVPFMDAVKQTVMPGNATNAQVAAFLQVAHQYNLNAFIKEIYAFPSKGGGIQPVVSVDGWISIAQRDPRFNGYEYEEIREGGKLEGGKVTIFYTDEKRRPFVHSEWFTECKRNTDPWNNMPRRMMENRTTVQGLRRALGIHGIMDTDEAEQMNEINITAESTVMSKETASKTETLKKRIGAVKDKEKAPEAPKAPVAPETPAEPIQEADINPAKPEEAPTAPAEEFSLFPEDVQPDRKITEEERKAILTILKTKGDPQDDSKNAKIMEVSRKYFLSIGVTNTQEIRLSQYAAVIEWAKALTV